MNAVDQQLARMDTPRTAAANTVADPSPNGATPSSNASRGTQAGALSTGALSTGAVSVGAMPQQSQTAVNLSKN